jgi:hypothetical protein
LGPYTYPLQGRIFRIYLLRLHLLDLSVTIQMISPYLIITLTIMLESWLEFNIAANTMKAVTSSRTTLLHYATSFYYRILLKLKPYFQFEIHKTFRQKISLCITICQCYSSTGYWLSVAFHQILPFKAPSGVRLFFFTLPTSF